MVMRGHKVAAVLDAKYRDLWEKALPADMLYQLAIYALLQDSSKHESVILYPTIDSGAVEQIITLHEPASGMEQAQVILRPVKLLELEQLLRLPNDYSARQNRCELAEHFAFGI